MAIPTLTDADKKFLACFLPRGWLIWDREDNAEHLAVERGIREGLLKRDCSEAKFTAKGISVLAAFTWDERPEC